MAGKVNRFLSFLVEGAVDSHSGYVQPNLVCPHCGTHGRVRTKATKTKQGVSGGKATAAVLTGGASLLATGLSHKGRVTKARCEACGTNWTIT